MEKLSKPWYKKWWKILLVSFLTIFLIILVAFIFYFHNLVKTAGRNIKQQQINLNQQPTQLDLTNNYWAGSAQPIVTIVEFADFACGYCKNSYTTIREISLKYKNQLKFVFKDYPLQENSLLLAQAARCAGEQGLFWLMHDKLFQNQGVSTTAQLTELANQIGADLTKFQDCLTKQKYLPQIQKDFDQGQALGLAGTPIWFINGNKVAGDIPYIMFMQMIETLLNK